MPNTKQFYIDYFQHMEDEDKKDLLGGMALDDVSWHFNDAIENGVFNKFDLAFMFPRLFGNLMLTDNVYKDRKKELESSKDNYLNTYRLLKTNTQPWRLVTDDEKSRLELAERYLQYAKNCDYLLECLEKDKVEYEKWVKSQI